MSARNVFGSAMRRAAAARQRGDRVMALAQDALIAEARGRFKPMSKQELREQGERALREWQQRQPKT